MLETGVYQIRNIVNGKVYIGSTSTTFKRRWKYEHRKFLREYRHENPYLQRAWNKYGEENFVFEILERCENTLEREQWFLSAYEPWRNEKGYNISQIAVGNNNNGKTYYFISPEGEEVAIHNLKLFCRENNLSYHAMLHINRGNQKSHKGWTTKDSQKLPDKSTSHSNTYEGFIDPHTGEEVTIINMKKFCKDNSLNEANMHAVYRGKRKQHKGWTINDN